ncbi:hypothetical protein IMZ48_27515 [Candidatus Bathyarchaeota archaeon]|nr:hypothetical protein [Candidatus Bathyarchaeota archaeon]
MTDGEEDEHNKSLDEYKASKRGQFAPKSLDWDSVLLPGEKVTVEESEDGDLGIGLLLSLGGSDVG